MQGWLDPVGPESAGTYWLRRGIIAVVLVALIAGASFLFTRGRGPAVVATGPSPSVTSDAARPPTSASTATETTSSTGSELDASDEPVTTAAEPSPAGPQPCRPQALSLRVDGPDRVSPASPVTFIVAVNTTEEHCILDLAAAEASLLITSGSDRIWASDGCPDWQTAGILQLTAGEEGSYAVGWPVRRASGCELSEATLGAGTYVATASIGSANARRVLQLQS